jgi:urease accessory protein
MSGTVRVLFTDAAHSGPAPQVILQFERAPSGETFLARRFVTYPFFLTAPFRLDRDPAGMLTTILQSVSGGIYEHEQLALSFAAAPGAQAHCTTQSATVVHAMPNGGQAAQVVNISAAAASFVEYLPDPVVLFPTAHFHSVLQVVAAEEATVLFSDAFVVHDPEAQGRPFGSLSYETRVQRPDGRLLGVDRFTITGEEMSLASPTVQQEYTGHGTFWVLAPHSCTALLPALRAAIAGITGLYAGVSTLPGNAGVWARLLARDAVALQKGLQGLWTSARRVLTGAEPANRRKAAWE